MRNLALFIVVAVVGMAQVTAPVAPATFTIAGGLPSAVTFSGKEILITDAASICDTTIGSGAIRVLAISNGTIWVTPNCGGNGNGGGSGQYSSGSSGGGGSAVGSQAASLTFGTMADGACSDQTFTFTGISTSTQLTPGWPNTLPAGFLGLMFSSASNTVDTRLCNVSGAPATLSALTFTAKIANYYLTNSSSLTFSAISDGGYGTQTLTLTGTSAGDPVVLGPPAALGSGLVATAVATSSNTVTVTVYNSSGAPATPTGTYTATIAK